MATKDIDVVVEGAETLNQLREALLSLSYRELKIDEIPDGDRRLNPSAILVKESSPRLDIFVKRIAGKIILSEAMKARATLRQTGKLLIHILSNEDLFILKSVTGREGDIQDMTQLAKAQGFNWGTVIEELNTQEEATGLQLCMTLLEGVEAVQNRTGIRVPIMHRLENHVLDHTILDLLQNGRAYTIQEIRRYINYPDYRIKASIKRLKDKDLYPSSRTKRALSDSIKKNQGS